MSELLVKTCLNIKGHLGFEDLEFACMINKNDCYLSFMFKSCLKENKPTGNAKLSNKLLSLLSKYASSFPIISRNETIISLISHSC